MKMRRVHIMITVLALLLTLTACGKSEFGVTENTWKHLTITAQNADKDASLIGGGFDVADGEQIVIAANLSKGSVRVEIVRPADHQGTGQISETDGEAVIAANLDSTESASGTVPAGIYQFRATCLEKATGTIQIDVVPVENSGPADSSEPAAEGEASEAAPAPVRQDGERFDDVIILEGMEETVHYEHVRNAALGFEMDYDYENFVRQSRADRECFVSNWDDPANPENYLEVRHSSLDAEAAAEEVCGLLSAEYEVRRDDAFTLQRAGKCICIDADEVKGGGYMPDLLQTVYIVPAGDGCLIATAHCFIAESEGFLRRFGYMMNTFSAVGG